MRCCVHSAKGKRISFMVHDDYQRAARCLALMPLLLLVMGASQWTTVAAAQRVNQSTQPRLASTVQVLSPVNGSNAITCTASSQTLLTTATVQSDRADPVLTNNTAVLCLTATVTLGQRVWEDLNGNGQQDAEEPGLIGVTVQLLSDTGALLQTTSSTVNGAYAFTGLVPGTYRVHVLLPFGYQFTAPNQGTNDTVDSDVDPATGRTAAIVLADATGSRDWAAGLFRPVTIGDRIWKDVNGNGVLDSGEPGLAGMTVQLFDNRDTLIASATTAANGAYSFQGLPPGDYYLLVVPPTTP